MTTLQESPTPIRDDHVTPPWLISWVEAHVGPIDLDPCGNQLFVHKSIKRTWLLRDGEDGLSRLWDWAHVYVNPPYGRVIAEWIDKALFELERDAPLGQRVETVTMLLPARTDTGWWKGCFRAQEWLMLNGRVRFLDPDTGRPQGSPKFGSVVVIFRRGLRHAPAVSMLDVREVCHA